MFIFPNFHKNILAGKYTQLHTSKPGSVDLVIQAVSPSPLLQKERVYKIYILKCLLGILKV